MTKTQWQDEALDILREFISGLEEGFTATDLRTFASVKGFSEPKDRRSWGAVLGRAKSIGLVRNDGFVMDSVYGRAVTRWRAV